MFNRNSTTKGFTLIELLVVISIISLLSTVILGSLNKARAKSRDARRLQDIVQMRTALELYAANNNGKYPLNTYTDGGGNTSYHLGWVASSLNCYPQTDGVDGITMANGLVSGKYISKIPSDPKPSLGECYLYLVTESGNEYKFMIYGTMETFNPQTTNHPLRDRRGAADNTLVIHSSVDPEDVIE